MDELFPIFVKLRGRHCLVVGGGPVAESKMESLLRCGAKVRVVAPEISSGIRHAAEEGKIAWSQRAFLPADLEDAFLVVAATSSSELHEEIFRQARSQGVLCNAVDEPERCDFYYPAVVRRGPLQIAISTGGRSPALAQRLRQQLEKQFDLDYAPWTEELGRQRERLLSRNLPSERRRALLHELCSERALEEFRARQAAPEKATKPNGKVYFLGAGPGDPELLTLKAQKILCSAEVILHDALVPPEILQVASARALLRDVGKRCGRKSITQETIHEMLIGYASAGNIVIRLQGGDPLLFGRLGEEIAALQEAGIDFEVVPGVTAASAAAAAAQIPLTDRRVASKAIFFSAHRHEGEFDKNFGSLAAANATLVIYMPGSNYARVWEALSRAGWAPDTPCLIVSQASLAKQIVCRAELSSLKSLPALPTPALLIVGAVTAARKPESAFAVLA